MECKFFFRRKQPLSEAKMLLDITDVDYFNLVTSLFSICSLQRRPGDEVKSSTDNEYVTNSINESIIQENDLTLQENRNVDPPPRKYSSTLPRQRVEPTVGGMGLRENSYPNLLANRENSSASLRNMLNFNKPLDYSSAVPPKALKLMGDDIFSPIGIGKILFLLLFPSFFLVVAVFRGYFPFCMI